MVATQAPLTFDPGAWLLGDSKLRGADVSERVLRLQIELDELLLSAFDTLVCEDVDVQRMTRFLVAGKPDCGILVDGERAFEVVLVAEMDVLSMRWTTDARIEARWVGTFARLNGLPAKRAQQEVDATAARMEKFVRGPLAKPTP